MTNILTNHWQYSAAVNNIYTGLIRLTGTLTLTLEDEGPLKDYITGPLTLLTKGFHSYFIVQDLLNLSPFQLAKDGN